MDTKPLGDAYFALCPDCEKHGYIVFRDGARSEEIFDEDSALLVIKHAVQQKKLSPEESVFLRTMVQSIKLPDYSHFLVLAMRIIDIEQKRKELETLAGTSDPSPQSDNIH